MDEDGLYFSSAQLQFFLNRRDGPNKLSKGDSEFFSYYNNCRTYNLIYDMLDKDVDCAKMYWDSELVSMAFSFPMNGPVARVLAEIKTVVADEEGDDEEDTFGLFS